MSSNDAFTRFQSTVAFRQMVVRTKQDRTWKYYDHGPKDCVRERAVLRGPRGDAVFL